MIEFSSYAAYMLKCGFSLCYRRPTQLYLPNSAFTITIPFLWITTRYVYLYMLFHSKKADKNNFYNQGINFLDWLFEQIKAKLEHRVIQLKKKRTLQSNKNIYLILSIFGNWILILHIHIKTTQKQPLCFLNLLHK